MDTEKLFYLAYFKFLEQYGQTYFSNHPFDDKKKTRIMQFVFQKKNHWRNKKPYRQGMYAIEISEARREKRYLLDKHTKSMQSIAGFIWGITVCALMYFAAIKKVSISVADCFSVGSGFILGYINMHWDQKVLKKHSGKIKDICEDLQESEEIMQERSNLLLQILQEDFYRRGYKQEEIVQLFINQCEIEISHSPINKMIDIIKTFIVPLLLGMCFLLSNKGIAILTAIGVVIVAWWFIFAFCHSRIAGIFGRLTKEELCYRAFLDCLNYIKLKRFNLNIKPVLKKEEEH